MTIREKRQACIAVLKDNFKTFCEVIEELLEDKLSQDEFFDLTATIDATMLYKLTKILGQNVERTTNRLRIIKALGHPEFVTDICVEPGFIAQQEKEGGKDDN